MLLTSIIFFKEKVSIDHNTVNCIALFFCFVSFFKKDADYYFKLCVHTCMSAGGWRGHRC